MNKKLFAAAIVAGLALTGCGSLSKINQDGQTDNPVFPKVDDATFETGSYPNLDDLRQVRAGVTRDQLYELLGRPHFSEGFQVREWDYLFHFNTAQGHKTCQFKVLFDKEKIARNFHWSPEECANILNPAPARAVAPMKSLSLSGDVNFAFASAALTAAGLNEIRKIANQLRQFGQLQSLMVSGHTDRIGDDASNQRLSQQRAESVRRALIAEGIPSGIIQAQGYGESQPVVQCDEQSRNDLIACLAPNRRVDIEVRGAR